MESKRDAPTLSRVAIVWTALLTVLASGAASALGSAPAETGPTESTAEAPRGESQADPDEERHVDDEITVTARKREEALIDVPIAIAYVPGERLREDDISGLGSLSRSTLNFTHSEDVNSFDRFIVRGLGTTGSNLGFEEAVGQVINGFFFGRSRFGRTLLFDVEQVEVLKGPQGALVGKNNSVGAINITTKRPGSELGGLVTTTYGFADGPGFSIESAVDVPFSEDLTSRFAIRFEDREGWIENLATGRGEQDRDDVTARGLIDWRISDTLQVELMIQIGDLRRSGRSREIYNCEGDAGSDDPLDPGEDCVFNRRKDVLFLVDGEPRREAHDTEYSMLGLTLEKFFDRASVTYLGNHAEYRSADDWDSDHSEVEWTHIFVRDDWRQTSHELRVTTFGGERIDTLGGIYASDQRNDFIQSFMFCRAPFALCTGGRSNPDFRGLQRHGWSTLETSTFAVFGQIDWHVTDRLTLTVGGRYTSEKRETDSNATVLAPYALEVDGNQVDCPNVTDELDGVGIPIGFDCGPARFTSSAVFDRSETDFSPEVTLRFKPSNRSMVYSKFGEGFKSGGFQFPNYVPQETLTRGLVEYGSERTRHFEIGGKHSHSASGARVQWAAWSTDFEDVQVSAFDAVTVIQNVNNAARASSTGVEADVTWEWNEGNVLSAAAAWTEAEYDEFPNGPCYPGQSAERGCRPTVFADGTVASVQDLAGTPLAYAPEWQWNLRWRSRGVRLTSELDLGWELSYSWIDDVHFKLTNDPLDTQEAHGTIDASVRIDSRRHGWTLSVLGKNLSDELTASLGDSTTGVGQTGDVGPTPNYKFADPGRQVALQLAYRF